MSYLYGDSTTSSLKSNFLEFLRDAIDFCVFVLQADAKMKLGRHQIRYLSEESDAELARLERFIISVQRAVHNGEKGQPDSPTEQCANRLAALITDAHHQSIEGIRRALAGEVARVDAEEAAARDACVRALGMLLAPHEPPDGATILRLGLLESGRYDATLDGQAEPSLAWTLEVGIPDGHAWSSPMRIDRIMPHLEIRAPQMGGWITKEVRVRPQKIERYVVTEIVDGSSGVSLEIRTEPTSGIGFDFDVDPDSGTVQAKRVSPTEDASVGPFEMHPDDAKLIVDLAKKLRASLSGLERRPNIAATFEGNEFRTLPTYVDFVRQLVEMMGPVAREIAARSLTPNELVLRRALGNDRREEIFVAKATLREKLAVLPATARELFVPLGLDPAPKNVAQPMPPAPPPVDAQPPVRSELPPSPPPSAPPPATGSVPPGVRRSKLPPPPTVRSWPPPASAVPGGTLQPPSAVAPPANPPDDTPQIEVVEEVEMSSDALLASIPESSRTGVKPEGQARNEALVAALKKILTLSRNGRAVEAYQEYANLFSSDAFADYRVDEQRQAIRLMVMAKSHPADHETVAMAHRAALTRLLWLAETSQDPVDQELLGMTHLYLGDEKAASAAFQTGLDLERAKNPTSELVATLMRRVSQI